MILLQQRFLRNLLLFMLVVLINVYLGIYIDSEVLKKNCFPYETAFENFRDEEVSEEVINSFLYDSEPMEESDITEQKIKSVKYADFAKLSEYLAMYFALNNTCSDSDLLEENISFVKEHQPEKFERIQSKIEAMWTDAVLFPVGAIENEPGATVDFANSWRQSRTFGGDRFHEGCDIMASVNQRVGWGCGKYRMAAAWRLPHWNPEQAWRLFLLCTSLGLCKRFPDRRRSESRNSDWLYGRYRV